MKNLIYAMAMVFGLSGISVSSASAQGIISSDEARTIALDRVHGEILNIGLENEDDTRVYDVDMRTRYGSVEVIINASNGQVLELKKVIEDSGD